MDARAVTEFLAHRGSRQLAYAEGWNATVSVWEGVTGRALKVNGKADASDFGDMDTQIIAALAPVAARPNPHAAFVVGDRKSTRLNSSHEWISYAVFCLK